jgi:soluble lytic murein transglycosylase-like protein
MNSFRTVNWTHLLQRVLVVVAGLVALCHLELLFGSVDADAELVLYQEVRPVEDSRVKPLAGFIQTRFRTDAHVAEKAAYAALQSSRETGLPATLILAVASVESSFKPLSDNGHDKGIMQVNPKWHPEKVAAIGGVSGLFDVALGIKTGARILKEYSDASNSDVVVALLRYNGASSFNEYPGKVLAEKKRFDRVLARSTVLPKNRPCIGGAGGCYTTQVQYPYRDPI